MYCYFDETKFEIHGSEYIALAGVFLTEANKSDITEVLCILKEELEGDQFLGIRRSKKIFHFTDDNLEVKPRVIECLRVQNIRVYIAYKKFEGSYQDLYHTIISKILFDRFQKYHTYEPLAN